MKAESIPCTWDQYSSTSSEENENIVDNPLITEATKQIFLRKYSSFPLTKEELLEVFEVSNYDDDVIKSKLDEKLAKKQENKKNKSGKPKSHKKPQYTNYYSSSNKKNKYYGKPYQGNYYKKNNGKSKYKTEIIEIEDFNDLSKKGQLIEVEVEVPSEPISFGDIKKDLNEIDEDDKVTSTATTSNKGTDLLSQNSNDCKSNNDIKAEDFKQTNRGYANYFFDPLNIGNSDIKINNFENGMYASKLFPGVFFNKPIDLSFHKEKSADFTKKKNANDGLSRAFEYYSSFFEKGSA